MHPKLSISSENFLVIFFVAFPLLISGQRQLINCYVNCKAKFQFGEEIGPPPSCPRQERAFCTAMAHVHFVDRSVDIDLTPPKEQKDPIAALVGIDRLLPEDLIPLLPGIRPILGIERPPLAHTQRMIIQRTGSFRSLEIHIGVSCFTDATCATNFVQQRVQHLIEKLSSSMTQFWTSIDDILGSSSTINANLSSLECYLLDGKQVNCEPNENENHCSLRSTVIVGFFENTGPSKNESPQGGCTHEGDDNTTYIEIQTFKVEPAIPQVLEHGSIIKMKCLKPLCNGGDLFNKFNQLVRTTFPIIEVDLSNAEPTSVIKPTSVSHQIVQEIRLGYSSLLLLLISNYLFH